MHAIATVGVDTLLVLLTHQGGGLAKGYKKLPATYVEMVTPDGRIIRMPEQAAADPILRSEGSAGGTRTWTLDPKRVAERDALAEDHRAILPKGREEAESIMQALDEGKGRFEGRPRRSRAGEPPLKNLSDPDKVIFLSFSATFVDLNSITILNSAPPL